MRAHQFCLILLLFASLLITGCPKKPQIELSTAELMFAQGVNTLTFQAWNANSRAEKLRFSVSTSAPWISSINPDTGESSGPAAP